MGKDELSHRGRRSKHRQRRGPWEIRFEWKGEDTTGVWKSYVTESMARTNCEKLNKQYGSSAIFTVVFNKKKEKNGH